VRSNNTCSLEVRLIRSRIPILTWPPTGCFMTAKRGGYGRCPPYHLTRMADEFGGNRETSAPAADVQVS